MAMVQQRNARKKQVSIVVLASLIGLLLVVASEFGKGSQGASVEVPVPKNGHGTSAGDGSFERGRAQQVLIVDVAGEVKRPGVYSMQKDQRVVDAIHRAGGTTKHANVETLNRAAKLVDGQQILVPAITKTLTREITTGTGSEMNLSGGVRTKVSINSATVEQLDGLPGIGPITAKKIVDDRSSNGYFTAISDLDRIPGIGPATIRDLESIATL